MSRRQLNHTKKPFTDFTALRQVPRHLGSRRGWDGPPGSRRVAVLTLQAFQVALERFTVTNATPF